ncbi:hypothetical protein D9M70_652230 [compost metagenome]
MVILQLELFQQAKARGKGLISIAGYFLILEGDHLALVEQVLQFCDVGIAGGLYIEVGHGGHESVRKRNLFHCGLSYAVRITR